MTPSADRRGQRGATLVEVVVVLGIIGLTITALGGMARASRISEHGARADGLTLELADAGELLVRDLRGGMAPQALGDTALELSRAVGVGESCVAEGRTAVPREMAWWDTGPESGDTLWWHDAAGWQGARMLGSASGACADGRPADVLDLSRRWAADALVPVRVLRRVRWVSYRDGAGRWSLGFRQRTSTWSSVQPVVGPFDALRLRAVPGGVWTLTLTASRGSVERSVTRSVARRNVDAVP